MMGRRSAGGRIPSCWRLLVTLLLLGCVCLLSSSYAEGKTVQNRDGSSSRRELLAEGQSVAKVQVQKANAEVAGGEAKQSKGEDPATTQAEAKARKDTDKETKEAEKKSAAERTAASKTAEMERKEAIEKEKKAAIERGNKAAKDNAKRLQKSEGTIGSEPPPLSESRTTGKEESKTTNAGATKEAKPLHFTSGAGATAHKGEMVESPICISRQSHQDQLKMHGKMEMKSTCDVVKNGEPQSTYSRDGGVDPRFSANIAVIAPNELATNFLVEIGPLPEGSPAFKLKEAIAFAHEPVCKPALYSNNITGLVPGPGASLSGIMSMTWNCLAEGSTLVTTQLLFELVDKSGENFWKGETKAVHFSVKKECVATKASQDRVVFPGLYIASDEMELARDKESIMTFADVVADGVVKKDYTIVDASANEHFQMTKVVPADKPFSSYSIVATEGIQLKFGAPLVFVQSGVASPELSGTAASGGVITNKKPLDLQVQYHCSSKGAAIVMLRFPMLPTGTLTFSVIKVCRNPDEDDVIRNEEQDLVPLDVGTGPMKSDVAQAGKLNRFYSMESIEDDAFALREYYKENGDLTDDQGVPHRHYVLPEESTIEFWLRSAILAPVEVYTPQIASFNPQTCKGTVIFKHQAGAMSTNSHHPVMEDVKRQAFPVGSDPISLTIQLQCLSNEASVAAMAVAIPVKSTPLYDTSTLTFSFVKICGGNASEARNALFPGLTYTAHTTLSAATSGVEVGTSPGSSDVVKGGLPLPNFTRYRKGMRGARFLAGPAVKEMDFYLRDDSSRNLTLGIPLISAHKPLCNPRATGAASLGGPLTSADIALGIEFNCVWEGTTAVTVYIPLKDNAVAENGGDTEVSRNTVDERIIFTLTKSCQEKIQVESSGKRFSMIVDDLELMDHDGDGLVTATEESVKEFEDEANNLYAYVKTSIQKSNEFTCSFIPQMCSESTLEKDTPSADQTVIPDGNPFVHDDDMELDTFQEQKYIDSVVAMHTKFTSNSQKDALTKGMNVGSRPHGNDVVKAGVAQDQYKMCELHEPDSVCPILAIVPENEITFFLSLEAEAGDVSSSQIVGEPQAFSRFPWVKASVVNARKITGQIIEGSLSVPVTVKLQCEKKGVTSPILVTLPIGDGLYSTDFRFMKVCGRGSVLPVVVVLSPAVGFIAFLGIMSVAAFARAFFLRKYKSHGGRDLAI